MPQATPPPSPGRWCRPSRILTPLCLLLIEITPVFAATTEEYLAMDLAQLMQVTITSVAKKPQTIADTPAAVHVISQEDIRRSGVTSIPEALTLAPGIQVTRISSSKWAISCRGFNGFISNKLLVLMDGRTVYNHAYNSTLWDGQNTLLEDIERIEVIRGPGGTIWGTNAVNGVINIITKKSQNTTGSLLRAGMGTGEKSMTGARQGFKLGQSAFGRLYVTGNNRDSGVLLGSDQDAFDDWNNLHSGFRMDGTVGKNNDWTVQGDHYQTDSNQITFPFWLPAPPYLVTNYDGYSSTGGNVVANWEHRTAKGDQFSAKAYYDASTLRAPFNDFSFVTIDLDLQYKLDLNDRHNLTMGAGYRQVEGDFTGQYQVIIPDQSNDLYSVFFQDEISLVRDKLSLFVGSKFENTVFTGNEWQPSARLLYKQDHQHSFWTSFTRAVRTPSMYESSGSCVLFGLPSPYSDQPVRINGNPDLDSEILFAYEAGYRWQANPTLSTDLSLYYNDYDGIYTAIADPTSTTPNGNYAAIRKGKGYGAEITTLWQAKPWLSLAFTYSWQKLDVATKNGLTTTELINETFQSTNTPRHQASLRATIDLSSSWQVNSSLRYVDSIYGLSSLDLQTTIPVPAYTVFDLNLIWKAKKNLEIMLAGQGLLDDSRLEYVSELFTPATEIERAIYAKVTWHF